MLYIVFSLKMNLCEKQFFTSPEWANLDVVVAVTFNSFYLTKAGIGESLILPFPKSNALFVYCDVNDFFILGCPMTIKLMDLFWLQAWLCDIERTMRWTLKDILKQCKVALKKSLSKRDKWAKDWPGQMLITSSQMQWTADVTKALFTTKERGDKKALKSMKKKQVTF